jgi:hypothetical protein
MTHEAIIKAYGFQKRGSCSCGGTSNIIYRKDQYTLYYRKRAHVFKVKDKSMIIVNITSLNKLETELKKLFPDVVIQEKEAA